MSELHPNIILEGGPEWQELGSRLRSVDQSESVLKIRAGNRYEHFHRTERQILHQGQQLHVFEWSRSTFVAE